MAKKEKFARFCKEKVVDELVERFEEQPNFVLTSFMGSSTADMEMLRKGLKKNKARYVVVKNSSLKVILEKIKYADEAKLIDSGMGVALSGDDLVSTCKTLVTFAKDHDKFKIKGGVFNGKSISTDQVKSIAALPSREVLLARAVGGIKAPITGFVNVLGGVLRKFVYVVDAIKINKQHSEGATSTQEAKA